MTKIKMTRRAFMSASAALIATISIPALAETAWPASPIKVIEAFAAGGSGDKVARAIGSELSKRLSQSIVVENKAGAGGMVGTNDVAKANPDGYTLLMTNPAMINNSASGRKLPFDLIKDFTPVGMIGSSPMLLVVPKDSPAKTLQEFLELARAKPNTVSYGSSGIGSMGHIGMEMLAFQANVKLLHVPYRGTSPILTDLMGGRVDATLGTVASLSSLLEGGKVRGLVVASPERLPFLPDVPSAVEAGLPQFKVDYWWGLTSPAGTPPEVVKRINEELNAVLAQPGTREMLASLAAIPRPGTPEDFGKLMTSELARWGKLIKDANIVIE